MKIVIAGSLGHIGRPLTKDLVKQGHELTVISSNPDKKIEIENLGAQAAIGTLDDASFLTPVYQNADAAFCMTPPNFGATDQIAYYRNIAESYAKAIADAKLKRVVYLSSYGAHLESGTGMITGSYHTENIFKTLEDVALTFVRPTYFYYNLLAFIPMIKSLGFIGSVYGGQDMLPMVAPEDIAAVVASELTKQTEIKMVQYVNSDDRSCDEVASILGRAIGIPDLKWHILPAEQVKGGLLNSGVPENAAANLIEMGQATHDGRLREDFDQHPHASGKVRIEDYAKDFALAYK